MFRVFLCCLAKRNSKSLIYRFALWACGATVALALNVAVSRFRFLHDIASRCCEQCRAQTDTDQKYPPLPPPRPNPPSPSPLPFPALRRFSCVLVCFLGLCLGFLGCSWFFLVFFRVLSRVFLGCSVGGLGLSWFFLGSVSCVSWVFRGFSGVLSWVFFGCSVGRLGFSCFFMGSVSGVSLGCFMGFLGFSWVFSCLSVLGGSWTARRAPSVVAAASTH